MKSLKNKMVEGLTSIEIARFWNSVNKNNASDCWLWKRVTRGVRYPQVSFKRRVISVHRLSYIMAHGPIPRYFLVCHSCDVRHCVNPAHLFLGTSHDNTQDMVKKGRNRVGSDQWNSKLTANQVLRIRRLYATGRYTQTNLASRFGVNQGHISDIILRKWWSHI